MSNTGENKDFVIKNRILEKYEGPGGDVVIPPNVRTIGYGAFWNHNNISEITSIVIPEGVSKIDKYAFCYQHLLSHVELPSTLKTIDEKAFSQCYELKSVVLPDGLKTIGAGAFSSSGLESVVIPGGVKSIGDTEWFEFGEGGPFENCCDLTDAIISSGVKIIGSRCFAGCRSLKKVEIPDTVNKIVVSAFNGCENMESISIPRLVSEIEGSTFAYCKHLESVFVHKGIKKIGYHAFCDCDSLKQIVVEGDNVVFAKDAFAKSFECTTDRHFVLLMQMSPTSLEMQDRDNSAIAFANSVEAGAELSESQKKTYLEYIKRTRKRLIPCAAQNPALLKIMLNENMFKKDDSAILLEYAEQYGNPNVLSLLSDVQSGMQAHDRPSTVKVSDELSANEAKILWSYDVKQDNTIALKNYKGRETTIVVPATINGFVVNEIGEYAFSTKGKRLSFDAKQIRNKIESITLPMSITKIGMGAFAGCSSLKSVLLPPNISVLEPETFLECTMLSIVDLPENLHILSDSIYKGTLRIGGIFEKCSNLSQIDLPQSLASIGSYSFAECENLKRVTIPDGVTKIGNRAFSGCKNLIDISMPDSVVELGSYAFGGCSSLSRISISAGLKALPNEAFAFCASLSDVIIPNGIEEIGVGSFSHCHSLKSVAIPESVEKIYASFGDCRSLETVLFARAPKRISGDAFSMCPSLSSFTIGGKEYLEILLNGGELLACVAPAIDKYCVSDGVKQIGENVLQYSDKLHSVVLSDSVEVIQDGAFDCCRELASVTIKNPMIKISPSAFRYCDKLTIHAQEGSSAEQYATASNITFLPF